MKLSERGYRKIKSYEGYGRRLPDGSCTAYQEEINGKLDIPTIGYGCTKSVLMGMVWTEAEADAKLREEIAGHEATVLRLVTVEINQNQFDALVSFDYNTGALGTSTILKRLNDGDIDRAAKAFAMWNKFNGKPSKGLTARRASEAAMFLEPVGPVDVDHMPQSADPPPNSTRTAVAATATGGAVVTTLASVDPGTATSTISAWHGLGKTMGDVGSWATSSKLTLALVAAAGAYAAIVFLIPKIWRRT